MNSDYTKFIASPDISLRKAMELLDAIGTKVLFLEGEGGFCGALSDSDVRRYLLSGGSIQDPAINAAETKAKVLREGYSREQMVQAFLPNIDAVPVISEADRVIDVLTRESSHLIPVCEPNLSSRERDALIGAFDSGWISSAGPFVSLFEQEFGEFLGYGYCTSTSNGTQALALAMSALQIGPGDEVIIPNLTFGATANAVIQVGAVPVLADVSPQDWNIDVFGVEKLVTPRTKAVVPVHLYGYPANMHELRALADRYSLLIIEDAAEALGSYIDNMHVGFGSDAVCFSFFGNKIITTGEGGMVAFSDQEVQRKAQLIKSHGFSKQNRYWHQEWGSNFRLTNLQAAIGVAQLSRIEELLAKKIENAKMYDDLLKPSPNGDFLTQEIMQGGRSSYWLYSVLLPEGIDRELIMAKLRENGIETRPVFPPLDAQPAFEQFSRARYPISHAIHSRGISLPSSTGLQRSDIEFIANNLKAAVISLQRD